MSGAFLIPRIEQSSTERVAKVPVGALAKLTPDLKALLPSCVPSPFAEAEVMATILRALPMPASAPFTDVSPSDTQRQCFQRWQLLVKAVFLGRITLENVSLTTKAADNFGQALFRSRTGRTYQGILRSYDIPGLNPTGRKSRVVGGADEQTLVWAAPRLQGGDWGALGNTIHGADESTALDLLHAWRGMLVDKALWSGDGTAPPWMRGVDRMLDGYKPKSAWEQLQPDVRMAGPTRLTFLRGTTEVLLDVFLPVWSQGHVAKFQSIFRLRPAVTEGGVNLVEDRPDGAPARVGQFIQLVSAQRASNPGGINQDATEEVDAGDALLAGLGNVSERDPITGERWWLQDRDGQPGYKTAVYDPLLARVLQLHGARLALKEEDVALAPIFFPDSIRLARSLLNPPLGMSGVEFVTLKDEHKNRVKHWPLPMYGQQLAADLPLPPPAADFVLALENSPSAACLLERLNTGNGVVEVGEVRALGALLWELFVGETEFSKLETSVALNRPSPGNDQSNRMASQPTEGKPRIIFKDPLLAAVGSVLSDNAGQADAYKLAVRRRRATAQRFLTLWTATPGTSTGHESWLASLAVRVFIDWAFHGTEAPAAWGRVPEIERAVVRKLRVTRTLEIPVFTDVYPRRL